VGGADRLLQRYSANALLMTLSPDSGLRWMWCVKPILILQEAAESAEFEQARRGLLRAALGVTSQAMPPFLSPAPVDGASW